MDLLSLRTKEAARVQSRGRKAADKCEIALLFTLFLVWITASPGRAQTQHNPFWFPLNGKSYFLLGANYPWYNGYRGLDLSPYLGTKTIATVAFASPKSEKWDRSSGFANGHDLQYPSVSIRPGTTGFSADGIRAQFEDMHDIGIRVLRWFFGGDGRSFMIFDEHGDCTGIDATALQNVDQVVALAKTNQIYLVPVLFDFRFISGDHWLKFEDGTSGTGHAEVIRDSVKRRSLIDNFVQPLAKRYANAGSILYWEIMNEAGNVVQGTDPVTGFTMPGGAKAGKFPTVSVTEMQTFMNEVYDAIKSVDQTHPVMPSGLGRPWQLPLVVGRVKADLFGAHYKDDGSDYGRIQPVAQIRSELKSKFGLVLDKPLVMTEGPAEMNRYLNDYLRGAFSGGWAGYFPWTYYRLIGLSPLRRYSRIMTSRNGKPQASVNIDLFRMFNRDHADAVKLGM
jgi:hypothetical protein